VTKRLRSLFFAAIPCLLWGSGQAFAVVTGANPSTVGYSNTTDQPVSGLNNVGVVFVANPGGQGVASGVYLGNGWVLTAYHVVDYMSGEWYPTLQFNTPTASYNANPNEEFRLNNPAPDGTPTDLALFQIEPVDGSLPDLPTLTIAGPNYSPVIGDTIYNAGGGMTRNTALQEYNASFQVINSGTPAYEGYGVNTGVYTLTWGQNAVYNVGTDEDPASTETQNIGFGNVTLFGSAFINSPDSDQLLPGDSGGGVFNTNNVLIGINDADGTYNDQPYSALFGDSSYYVNLATYSSEIESYVVPEPTSAILLAATVLPVLLRRRRAAAI
jgi:S1-C subfamily serine protease